MFISAITQLVIKPIKEIQDTFITTENYLKNLKIREGSNKPTILNNATFMLLNKENISRKYIDHYLATHQIEMNNVIEVDTMDLLIEFTKIDLGVACVIKELVQNEIKNGTFLEVSFKTKIPKRKLGLCYSNVEHLNDEIKKFISYFPEI